MQLHGRLSREESRARTREELVSAARAEFLEKGFHAATLDEIALRANVTKGAVYSNFANKAELFLAVFDRHIEQRLQIYQTITPEKGVESVARRHAQVMLAHGEQEARWVSLQAEVWAYASSNPVLRKELADRRNRMLDSMFILVQKMADMAGVVFVLPTREMARAGQALLRGLMMERLLGKEIISDEQFVETFAAFVSGMARTKNGKVRKRKGAVVTPGAFIKLDLTAAAVDRDVIERHANSMQEREHWSRQKLMAYQQQQLRKTLEHATANSAYYRETLGHFLRRRAALEDLPVLTKSLLMEYFDDIVTSPHFRLQDLENHLAGLNAQQALPDGSRVVASGGTTGERAVIVYDQPAWEIAIANVLRWLKILDITPATRVVAIGSPAPIHLTNRLFPEIQAGRSGAPRLSVITPLEEITAALNTYQPEVLISYPSIIRLLAEEQLAGRLNIAPIKVAGTAETLADDVHELAVEAWGIRLRNMYGTTETGLIGTDCEFQDGIHLAEDLIVLEVVDEHNRPVAPGVMGHKVLVTTLFNGVLPLIRYEFSDVAAIAVNPCKCGRPWIRLRQLLGRREEFLNLHGRAGNQLKLHASFLREPLLRIPEVRQFQVSVSGDRVNLRVVLRSHVQSTILKSIRRTIQDRLIAAGAEVTVLPVQRVERIERAGTGAKEVLVGQSHAEPT